MGSMDVFFKPYEHNELPSDIRDVALSVPETLDVSHVTVQHLKAIDDELMQERYTFLDGDKNQSNHANHRYIDHQINYSL